MTVAADAFGEVRGAYDLVEVDAGGGLDRRRGLFSRRPRLEYLARLRVNGIGILLVALLEVAHEPSIDSRELIQTHGVPIILNGTS